MPHHSDATLLPALSNALAEGGKVHDSVVRTLGGWVLSGRYQPGDSLPREDALATSFGVSRTSVREAVKVLSAKGLLETRPRVGVKVRQREEWRMLDPAVRLEQSDPRVGVHVRPRGEAVVAHDERACCRCGVSGCSHMLALAIIALERE